jgi:hypothetical protein
MSDQPIVVDARSQYLQTLKHRLYGEDYFREGINCGLIALGLELETRARMIERVGDIAFEVSVATHVASALRNALDEVGIRDQVLERYDEMVKALATDAHGGAPASSRSSTASYDDEPSPHEAADRQAPGPLDVALDRLAVLDAADASWPMAGGDLTLWAYLAPPGLTIEGYEELSTGVYTPRERSSADQEQPYGDEGKMDEV